MIGPRSRVLDAHRTTSSDERINKWMFQIPSFPQTPEGDLRKPIDELPRPFPWDIRAWCLRRRFGFKLSFSYFLTTQAAIGPRQRLQSLARNVTGTGNTYAVRAVSNSPKRSFDHSDHVPALAGLPKQGFLCEAAGGFVAAVLWRVNIQRPCFARQSSFHRYC
jgi:hypothetical protein